MSMIKELAERLQPQLTAAKADLNSMTRFRVMKFLIDDICSSKNRYNISRVYATQLTSVMTISIENHDDVQTAVDFLYQGFELSAETIMALAGELHFPTLLEACRGLSIEG